MDNEFAFSIGQDVKMKHSDEAGEVVGRAEYAHQENLYYVRYLAGDGRQVETWWGESALTQTS